MTVYNDVPYYSIQVGGRTFLYSSIKKWEYGKSASRPDILYFRIDTEDYSFEEDIYDKDRGHYVVMQLSRFAGRTPEELQAARPREKASSDLDLLARAQSIRL